MIERMQRLIVLGFVGALLGTVSVRALADDSEPDTTPDAPNSSGQQIDFSSQIMPLLKERCGSCHTRGQSEGGLSLNTRELLLKGGDSGPAVVVGRSGESLLLQLVRGDDPDRIMPAKGKRLEPGEVALLAAWIDQGTGWKEGFRFDASRSSAGPRRPEVPAPRGANASTNPIDLFLGPYYQEHGVQPGDVVSDRAFARRATLDLVGLLPTTDQIHALETDNSPNKRARFVRRLLDDRTGYATHWLTFWNDALRNEYRGTGFIDDGRSQITPWLYSALYDNKPYDRFVYELISATPGSEGFTKGIVWRGVVNASQRPEMQAAQNVSQVFLGTNLKCASCHNSFVNDWSLMDAYRLAGVFAAEPLEIHHCDKPTGEKAEPAFLYGPSAAMDAKLPRAQRMTQRAGAVTSPENGRFARTIVNRLWAQLMGRGLVEPVDDMDAAPWHRDLLDWLAADLTDHGYDLKQTLALIATSQAYQHLSAGAAAPGQKDFVFRGPVVKRMSAEQFADAVSTIAGVWETVSSDMQKRDGRGQMGQLVEIEHIALAGGTKSVRSALTTANPLTSALGRPAREQVVTRRDSQATMIQALELTNGATLDATLKRGAEDWLKRGLPTPELIEQVYQRALGRGPANGEMTAAAELIGSPPTVEGIQDFFWTILMLPEFQLIQ